MDFKKLAAPFPYSEIQWRVGATFEKDSKLMGLALAYYDCRALYDRLDEVCGPENWQIRYPHADVKTCAEIGIRINDEWVFKANGAGDSQAEAEKGAFSDAAKRAGVPWGIGRYLYQLGDTWVECEKRGKSTFIKKSEHPKLAKAYADFVKSGVRADLSIDGKKDKNPQQQWLSDKSAELKAMTSLSDVMKLAGEISREIGSKELSVPQVNWINNEINKAQDRLAPKKQANGHVNYLEA